MNTNLFTLVIVLTALQIKGQEPIFISPAVGNEIDLAEKKQYRLFPYYSSQLFVSSSIYMLPDSTMQLRTKMAGDSMVTKPFSKQELVFLRSMTGFVENNRSAQTIGNVNSTMEVDNFNKGFYINFGAAYYIPLAGTVTMYDNNNSSTSTGGTNTYEAKSLSGTFGKGLQFGLTLGTRINKNLAIDLNSSLIKGSKLSESYSSPSQFSNSKGNTDYYYSGWRFTPSIKLILPGSRSDLYFKNGMVISIKNKLIKEYSSLYSDSYSSSTREGLREYTGGISLGYSGGIGCNFSLNKTLSIFSELNFVALSWAPKQGEILESKVNGVDQMPFYTIYDKKIEFHKNYTETFNYGNPPNTSVPNQQTRIFVPLSSIGLSVGLHISLGKK